MQIFKIILFIVILFSQLSSAPLDEKRIIVLKLADNLYRMKIFLNYENPYSTQATLRGRMTGYSTTIPIPYRFDVQSIKAEIKYTPSLILYPNRSIVAIVANENVVRQFQLNRERYKDSGQVTISSKIPIKLLSDYNQIGVQIIQHYTKGEKEAIEDTSAPELWTQIDLHNSFIEIDFKLKPFEEKISSIRKFFFDEKNIIKDSINFVFPKMPTDEDFYNYSFMANQIGNILKFRDIDFSISTKIIPTKNNVIIMSKKDLNNTFKDCLDLINNFEEKIEGNINIVQNPKRADKGILIITGEDQKSIKRALYRMVNRDILLLGEQSIKIIDTQIPKPAKPFTAPEFISAGEKILLSDLGYKTRTFIGERSAPLYLNFKLYPTVHFESSDFITTTLNIIQGGIMRDDSATNIFLNNILVYQAKSISSKDDESELALAVQRFGTRDKNVIPAKLLLKGKNSLRLEFAMVPIGGPSLVRFNKNILKLTLRDDSTISFPRGVSQVEYPNLKYMSDLGFPFSIYPDLQNTGILITDFDSRTITAVMYIAFYLGKMVNYPAYYLTVTPDINKILDKDIISVGSQVDKYRLLYKNAPIRFTKDGIIKEIALISKYKQEDNNRIKKHTVITTTTESLNFNDYLIAQTYQSPFNRKRVVLDFSSNSPATLLKGVRKGFTPIHLGKFDGDTWLYNVKTDKSVSFRLKETYILNDIIDLKESNLSEKCCSGEN